MFPSLNIPFLIYIFIVKLQIHIQWRITYYNVLPWDLHVT